MRVRYDEGLVMSDPEVKTVKDLPGWAPGEIIKGLIGVYCIYTSPDSKQLAQVHLDDEEVDIIIDRETGKPTHIHPINLRVMKALGLDEEKTAPSQGGAIDEL